MNTRKDPIARTLGVIVMAAVAEADGLRRHGADAETVNKAIEAVIREAWPKGREEAWHLLCEQCVDTGWDLRDCPGDASCDRQKVHAPHRYAVPCWCAKGRGLTPKPKAEDDELASVGKTTKPSRWGR